MNSFKVFSKTGIAALAIAMMAFIISACNKQFDQPASNTELGVTATHTIMQFKAMAGGSGSYTPITTDVIITGVVSANDKSGNLYKEIYMQDATGGISILLDANGLYTNFPVGREVAILCKGLWIANVNNMRKIGVRTVVNNVPSVTGIPAALINTHTRRGALNQPLAPKVVTVSQLNTDLQGMLVRLENFEVVASELDWNYADTSANKNSVNIDIKNCSGDQILFRNSGYANFAGFKVPEGNGPITAIYTVYNSTKQLLIRDTSDLQFWGVRCDGTVPGQPVVVKSIQEIRALGAGTTIPGGTAIEGIVVSNTLNEASGNYRLQDASGYGIQLRFTTGANGNFALGDKLKVNISGLLLELYNGDMQINNVSRVNVTGSGTVTPRITTVADIITNMNTWASTVATLNNVTIAVVSSTGSGVNYSITDATGSIVSYVRNTLAYTLPISATSITGYVSIFNGTPQLTLRVPADVVGGVTPVTLLDQNFETVTTNADITLTGWQNVPETGGVKYQGKIFSSNKYAQVSAFSSAQAVVKSWLVTPAFSLDATTGEVLTFKSKDGFNNGATLKVMVSTNYTGSATPWTATWTQLPATISSGTATGYAANWVSSGNIDLSSYSGTNVSIAFVYEGSDPAQTTTYQIDDVKVTGN